MHGVGAAIILIGSLVLGTITHNIMGLRSGCGPVTKPTPTAPAPTATPVWVPVPTATPWPTPVPTNTPVPPTVEPTPIWNTPTPVPTTDAQYVLDQINAERASHGIAPLTLNVKQSQCSQAHAQDMASTGHIWHVNPDNANDPNNFPQTIFTCSGYVAAGENVGEAGGYGHDASLDVINQAYLSEPYSPSICAGTTSHHCNINAMTYSSVGIGVYADSSGSIWEVEDFVG